MPILKFILFPVSVLAQAGAGGGAPRCQGLVLLQPIAGPTNIPTQGNEGLGVFGVYFNAIYPWIVGMGAGVALLMTVVGGLQMIQSGGDQTKRDAGKTRLLTSLGGLLIILL